MKDTINSIIRLDLCPLQISNQGNDYYNPLYRQLGVVNENFDANYKIQFEAPVFSIKVKYYTRLIDNTITEELNKLFSSDYDNSLIAFKRKKIAEQVNTYLLDIKDIINKNGLDLDAIFSSRDYSLTPHLNECTYIFHYLILSLIRLYMEFQHHFIEQISPDKQLTVNDFFVQTLQWKMPDKVGIETIKKVEIQSVVLPKNPPKEETLSFLYTDKKNRDKIVGFMDSLKRYGFIASDTTTTDFKHIFTGKKVENPVRWTTDFGGLLDLFRQLKKNKLIEYEGSNMYKIVCACFVDADGNHFDETKFRNGKIAKKITSIISDCVKQLK
jgi:hypothetical protein